MELVEVEIIKIELSGKQEGLLIFFSSLFSITENNAFLVTK